jgi:hypothetical protein
MIEKTTSQMIKKDQTKNTKNSQLQALPYIDSRRSDKNSQMQRYDHKTSKLL